MERPMTWKRFVRKNGMAIGTYFGVLILLDYIIFIGMKLCCEGSLGYDTLDWITRWKSCILFLIWLLAAIFHIAWYGMPDVEELLIGFATRLCQSLTHLCHPADLGPSLPVDSLHDEIDDIISSYDDYESPDEQAMTIPPKPGYATSNILDEYDPICISPPALEGTQSDSTTVISTSNDLFLLSPQPVMRTIGRFERQMMLPSVTEQQFVARGNAWVMVRVRPPPTGQESCKVVVQRASSNVKLALQYGLSNEQASGTSEHHHVTEGIFDHAFPPETSQEEIFYQVKPMVAAAIAGLDITIIADGHSGSGKTYTMCDQSSGIISRTFQQIYDHTEGLVKEGWTRKMEVSIAEVHCDKVYDLLARTSTRVQLDITKKNSGSTVRNLTFREVYNPVQFFVAIFGAMGLRTARCTSLNAKSSRSHLVVKLQITRELAEPYKRVFSELVFIDLAGREHLNDKLTRDEELESQQIGKDRSSIKDLLISRTDIKRRSRTLKDNALTKLTKQSLSTETKVLLITCLDPSLTQQRSTKFSMSFAQDIQNAAQKGRSAINNHTNGISEDQVNILPANEMCTISTHSVSTVLI